MSLYRAKLIPINTSLSDHGYGPGDQYLADVLVVFHSYEPRRRRSFSATYHQRPPYSSRLGPLAH